MPLPFVDNNTVKIKWLNIFCLWKGSRRIPPEDVPPPPNQFPWLNSPLVSPPRLIPPGEFLTQATDRREIWSGGILHNPFEKNMMFKNVFGEKICIPKMAVP